MNIASAVKHIIQTLIPSVSPKAGRYISVDHKPDGSWINCLLPQFPTCSAVTVRNSTVGTLQAGTVIKLSGAAETPEAGSAAEDVVFSCSIPAAGEDCALAIILDDIAEGQDGLAAISGAASARVTGSILSGRAAPSGTGTLSDDHEGTVSVPFSTSGWCIAIPQGSAGGTSSASGYRGYFRLYLQEKERIVAGGETEKYTALMCSDGRGFINGGYFSINTVTEVCEFDGQSHAVWLVLNHSDSAGWTPTVTENEPAGLGWGENTAFTLIGTISSDGEIVQQSHGMPVLFGISTCTGA